MKTEPEKCLFVGGLTRPTGDAPKLNAAYSSSGERVQKCIIDILRGILAPSDLKIVLMDTARTFPFSRLFYRTHSDYPGLVNLKGLKGLSFSISSFRHVSWSEVKKVIIYNLWPSFGLLLLLVRFFYPKVHLTCIIQDIKLTGDRFSLFEKICARIEILVLRRFDAVIAITPAVAELVNSPRNTVSVFRGGVDIRDYLPGKEDEDGRSSQDDRFILYAGTLNYYNGIDKVIKAWEASRKAGNLIVCGSGPLAAMVEEAATRTPSIKFHRLIPYKEIQKMLQQSSGNICFRYSEGIDETHFFPSKIFEVVGAPGIPIMNKMKSLHDNIFDLEIGWVSEDIGEIERAMKRALDGKDDGSHAERLAWLKTNANWKPVLEKALEIGDSKRSLGTVLNFVP